MKTQMILSPKPSTKKVRLHSHFTSPHRPSPPALPPPASAYTPTKRIQNTNSEKTPPPRARIANPNPPHPKRPPQPAIRDRLPGPAPPRHPPLPPGPLQPRHGRACHTEHLEPPRERVRAVVPAFAAATAVGPRWGPGPGVENAQGDERGAGGGDGDGDGPVGAIPPLLKRSTGCVAGSGGLCRPAESERRGGALVRAPSGLGVWVCGRGEGYHGECGCGAVGEVEVWV